MKMFKLWIVVMLLGLLPFVSEVNQDHVYLVAGLNLPLLIELVSRLDAEVETTVLIQQVLTDSKKMIQFCNERLNQKIEEDEF